ncbi:hypothetical protein Tco_1506031 [Tanacetum coccineum]
MSNVVNTRPDPERVCGRFTAASGMPCSHSVREEYRLLVWWEEPNKKAKGGDVCGPYLTWAAFNELFFLQSFPSGIRAKRRLKRAVPMPSAKVLSKKIVLEYMSVSSPSWVFSWTGAWHCRGQCDELSLGVFITSILDTCPVYKALFPDVASVCGTCSSTILPGIKSGSRYQFSAPFSTDSSRGHDSEKCYRKATIVSGRASWWNSGCWSDKMEQGGSHGVIPRSLSQRCFKAGPGYPWEGYTRPLIANDCGTLEPTRVSACCVLFKWGSGNWVVSLTFTGERWFGQLSSGQVLVAFLLIFASAV